MKFGVFVRQQETVSESARKLLNSARERLYSTGIGNVALECDSNRPFPARYARPKLHSGPPVDFQIVSVNNSFAPYSIEKPTWQGTLHTATVMVTDESKRHVINSTRIASIPMGAEEVVSKSQEHKFVETTVIRRRDYGTLQRNDNE